MKKMFDVFLTHGVKF